MSANAVAPVHFVSAQKEARKTLKAHEVSRRFSGAQECSMESGA